MLITVLLAAAHVPHDVVWALAAPRSLDAGPPWVAVYASAGVQNLLRSDDGGETWQMVAGDPLVDDILAATMLDDGTAVLLAADRYWWSTDGGEAWSVAAVPGAVEVAWGTDALYLGGADGVFRLSPGGAATAELAGVGVHALGPGPVAVADDDHVWRRDVAGNWSDQGSPGAGLTAAAFGNSRTYAGNDAGQVWYRLGATWRSCAALPAEVLDSGYPEIRHLAAEAYGLVVLPAFRGPYEGNPGCNGWRDRTGPDDNDYATEAGPASVEEGFTSLRTTAAGGWSVSGWDGVWSSADRGLGWSDGAVIYPDYTRSLAFSPDFPGDGTVWIGGYAAGVLLTRDAGRTVTAPSGGLPKGSVQRVYAATGAGTADTVYAVVNHAAYVSTDGGERWTAFGADLGTIAAMQVWGSPDEVWAFNVGAAGAVHETLDGGATWTALDGIADALGGARVVDAVAWTAADGAGVRCLLAEAPLTVACTEDGGASWERWYRSGADEAVALVAWPVGAADRLLVVDRLGLHRTDDGGATWVDAAPLGEDRVVTLGQARDGTLLAATVTGWLLRSDDGGDTWTELDLRADGRVYAVVPRPDGVDEALLATHDGVLVLRGATGGAPRLERWADVQRVDDRSDFWRCEGCGTPVVDVTAAMDRRTPLPAGATATFRLRGETLRVWGANDGAGSGSVVVDGVTVATLAAAVATSPSLLAEVGGLGAGVHRVELVGAGTAGLTLDAVEAAGSWSPLAAGEAGDADGDGQAAVEDGGTDCDDADPTVYAGAAETWYDGVDQDCSGGSDYDRDGDGYEAALHGGDDCRDGLATVNPGVPENPSTPYDDNCNRRLTD